MKRLGGMARPARPDRLRPGSFYHHKYTFHEGYFGEDELWDLMSLTTVTIKGDRQLTATLNFLKYRIKIRRTYRVCHVHAFFLV